MDRSLDEIVADRNRSNDRPRRGPPPPRRGNHDNSPRDGVRKVRNTPPTAKFTLSELSIRFILILSTTDSQKPPRDERPNLENDWMHDRYDDDPNARESYPRSRSRRDDHDREPRKPQVQRESPERQAPPPAKIRVDNLHYDLTEDDIYELFERIAPVEQLQLRYDRAGRSEGTAFVTYAQVTDARAAIRDFDGANAKGQPIRLALLPLGPAAGRSAPASRTAPAARRDNPFDRVENPRSLFDRIESSNGRSRRRSDSPGSDDGRRDSRRRAPPRRDAPVTSSRDRRSDVSGPPPENVDRYVPGQSSGRSPRRPPPGRRPGERREREGGGRGDRGDRGGRTVNGRPRKTQEELDAEMEDYWGSAGKNETDQGSGGGAAEAPSVAPAAVERDEDIDMIE